MNCSCGHTINTHRPGGCIIEGCACELSPNDVAVEVLRDLLAPLKASVVMLETAISRYEAGYQEFPWEVVRSHLDSFETELALLGRLDPK